jgi:hypothetical protein
MKHTFNKKKLKFDISDDIAIDTLSKASANIPKWYSEIPRFYSDDPSTSINSHTVKLCSPFLEAMIIGYHVLCPVDIQVITKEDGQIEFKWRSVFNPAVERKNENIKHVSAPTGYSNLNHFVWKFPVAINIPEGYSILITHPLNRNDLPFYTLSGVVDGEYTMAVGGNLPFFIKEGFNGIIKQGTPIAHVIPFKRENWEIEKTAGVVDLGRKNRVKTTAVISGWYKNNHWRKKQW